MGHQAVLQSEAETQPDHPHMKPHLQSVAAESSQLLVHVRTYEAPPLIYPQSFLSSYSSILLPTLFLLIPSSHLLPCLSPSLPCHSPSLTLMWSSDSPSPSLGGAGSLQNGSRERSSPVEEPLKSRCAGRLGIRGRRGKREWGGNARKTEGGRNGRGEEKLKCGKENQCIVSTRGPYPEVHVHSCHHVL